MKVTASVVVAVAVVGLVCCTLSATAQDNTQAEVSKTIRGIPVTDEALYTKDGTSFTCREGTTTIPFAHVNDDYCDCPDGSDEPGTSACNNGIFYCANFHHVPSVIRSGAVNDGVCDCCDGTDEWAATGASKCENTCYQAGAARRAELRAAEQARADGAVKKHEMMMAGTEAKRNRASDIANIEKEMEELKPEMDRLHEVKEHAERLEKLALERLKRLKREAAEADLPKAPVGDENDPLPEPLPDAPAPGSDEDEKTVDWRVEMGFESGEEEVRAQDLWKKNSPESREAQRKKRIEALKKKSEERKKRRADLEAEIADLPEEEKARRRKELHAKEREEERFEKDGEEDKKKKKRLSRPELDDDEDDEENMSEEEKKEMQFAREGGEEGLKLVPPGQEEAKIADADAAREAYVKVKNKVDSLNRQLESLRGLEKISFGENEEYFPLHGECTSLDTREYTYEICHFDRANQKEKNGRSTTNLGKWGEWVSPTQVKYDRGQKCYNGPQRSLLVNLVCGAETEFVSVDEPSKCEYEAVLKTPAACESTHEEVAALNAGHNHEEL